MQACHVPSLRHSALGHSLAPTTPTTSYAQAGEHAALQAHFLTVSRTLDSRPAAAVAVLGLVPVAGPLISGSMRLWRGSHVLGGEMVGEYVSKVIPPRRPGCFLAVRAAPLGLSHRCSVQHQCAAEVQDGRSRPQNMFRVCLASFLMPPLELRPMADWTVLPRRRNGLTIALFMLPSLMLMKVPVLGAAAVFPMAASAAWLVNLLEGNMTPDGFHSCGQAAGRQTCPTRGGRVLRPRRQPEAARGCFGAATRGSER